MSHFYLEGKQMLKRKDVFQWQGFGIDEVLKVPVKQTWVSRCERWLYEVNNRYLVIFSEVRSDEGPGVVNPGTSITNSIEYIATLTFREWPELYFERPQDIVWVEHYSSESRDPGEQETFDLVILTWDDQKKQFYHPTWKHSTRAAVEVLIQEKF
jgi:hypothetical protein